MTVQTRTSYVKIWWSNENFTAGKLHTSSLFIGMANVFAFIYVFQVFQLVKASYTTWVAAITNQSTT